MTRTNELSYGTARSAAALLRGEPLLDQSELIGALANAMERIDTLERRMASAESEIANLLFHRAEVNRTAERLTAEIQAMLRLGHTLAADEFGPPN